MSLLVTGESFGDAWRRRARMLGGHFLCAGLAVSSLALLVAVTGAAGMDMGQYLVVQVLSLYMGQGAPWLLITAAFGLTGVVLDPESGLAAAVLGNVMLAAIALAGWVLMRAASTCEFLLVAALDHPATAAAAAAALTATLTLWLSKIT